MNILIIARRLLSEGIGGVGRVLWESAEELAIKGNRIHIITSTENEKLPEYEIINGVNVHRFFVKIKNPLLSYIYRTKSIDEIFRNLLKRVNFDVVNIHGSGMLHSLFSSIKDTPLIYSYHASHPHELKFDFMRQMSQEINLWQKFKIFLKFPFYYYRYKWTENKALERASAVLTYSDFDRKEIIQFYGMKYTSKIKIIPCGVDTERFVPADNRRDVRQSLGLPEDKVIFLTVRRLTSRMGLENLIFAASKVVNQNNDILLLIGGKGSLYEKLNSLIKELNLQGNIKLLGFIEETLLPHYYQSADAFVLPSETLEGFGIVTIEALSCNLPVLGTPAGATPEILSQINKALIARDTSPDAIAETMLFLIDNLEALTSSDIYRKLVLEKYDWSIVGEKIETFFQRVISRNKI